MSLYNRQKIHLRGEPVPGRTDHRGEQTYLSLCGQDDSYLAKFASTDDVVSCPKCRSIIGKRLIATYNSIAGNKPLSFTTAKDTSYRSAYLAEFGGQAVGYIVVDGAYKRTGWHICPFAINAHGHMGCGQKMLDPKTIKRHYPEDLMFLSKEDALLAVPGLVEDGMLKTIEETAAAHTAHKKRWAKIKEDEARAKADEKQELEESVKGLRELLDQEPKITNFQRAGVMKAVAQLQYELRHHYS